MFPKKPNEIDPQRLYTIPDAAAALGLRHSELRGKLRAGLIGTVREGAERRIAGGELVRYLELRAGTVRSND